jgi:plastocyanin
VRRLILGIFVAGCCLTPMVRAQTTVSAKIVMTAEKKEAGDHQKSSASVKDVVVWLSPLTPVEMRSSTHGPYRLLQKGKQFHPHLLVVPTGTSVEFPNADPFFHNVFSLFNGKRFDLGLYETGTSRSVRFDREGASYIFCNIHPEMGAVVLALSTPFYGLSEADGTVTIRDVPAGNYRVNVWSESALPANAAETSRVVEVGSSGVVRLGEIPMRPSGSVMEGHTNKFGEEYRPEAKPPY